MSSPDSSILQSASAVGVPRPCSAFDLEAAKEQARKDYGSTSAFRVGISAAKLRMPKENPYLPESRGFTHFEKGYSYWQEQNTDSATANQRITQNLTSESK